MRIRVLGSGAGGGFPQWNCACSNCSRFRRGAIRARARAQASIAISAVAGHVVLINASPDIRAQINDAEMLHPPTEPRGTPIDAVLFTNADIDHVAGLLTLRESQPLSLYATERVKSAIVDHNAILRAIALTPGQSTWHSVELDLGPVAILDPKGQTTGLAFEAFAVPGKPPAYLAAQGAQVDPKDTIAYRLSDPSTGRAIVYSPGVKAIDAQLLERLSHADVLMFDATCFVDDELERLGIAKKTALSMGHIPIGGPGGSLEALSSLTSVRKIYTHINNTNPIIDEDSPERRAVEAAGFEVAFDGMEIDL